MRLAGVRSRLGSFERNVDIALGMMGGRNGAGPLESNDMVKRYICVGCGLSSRKDRKCEKCDGPLFPIDLDHTIYGILMYVLAGIALFMIFMAFVPFMGLGLLAPFSLIPLLIALGMNGMDDHELDKAATGIARRGAAP